MEQNKILEILLARMDADKAEAKRERKADKEEMMARMDTDKAESKTERKADKEIMARMEAKLDSNHERMLAKLDAWLGKTEACLEMESASEATEVVEESLEVPKGATVEEAFGATENRTGEQRLAVRRHRQQKKRAQFNGGPRQKFAAARGRFTRRAVPALLKGHVRKGPRRNCNSGIRRVSKTSGNRRGGRTEKLNQRVEAERMHRELIRKSLDLEIARLIVGSFIRLREPRNGTLWKCRPPPKRKR
jgi:hypothetical protein